MNHEYWLKRWSENRIGFHRAEVNPLLARFAARLTGGKPARVLVPLCGKSVDLRWLAEQGHDVVGVELSQLAIEAFANEQGVALSQRSEPPFTVFCGNRLTLYMGDLFALTQARVAAFPAIYDRAALIALPQDRRPAYAAHIQRLLAAHGRILLVTLEYDEQRMAGPPFSVPEIEVRSLFGTASSIDKLIERDCLGEEPHFAERGLTWLKESAYLLSFSPQTS